MKPRGIVRPIFMLTCLTLFGIVLAPIQWICVHFNLPLQRRIPMFFHKWGLPLLGVKIIQTGEPAKTRPLLICSNHVSWLDIPVISSLLPLIFVSKADVARWPVFGTLARLQRSIFIDRAKRVATKDATQEIGMRLHGGEAIVIFPEGTTSDGNRVLPFRSSLLGAAGQMLLEGKQEDTIYVQPVAIFYRGVHGLPLGRALRPYAAWYGDMTLVPHLLDLVRLGAIEVEVRFGEPVIFKAASDRKQLAAKIEERVRKLMQDSLRDTSCFSNAPAADKNKVEERPAA